MTAESPKRVPVEARIKAFFGGFRHSLRATFARPSCVGAFPGRGSVVWAQAGLAGARASVGSVTSRPATDVLCSKLAVTLSLPRHLFMAREVVLPAVDPVEIAGMLQFEMANLFPMPPEELTWDWHVLRTREDGYTACRVLAVETRLVSQRIADLDLAGIARLRVEPSTVSLANYCMAASGAWPVERVAIVARSSMGVDFLVLGPEGIEIDRGIPANGRALSVAQIASEFSVFLSMLREGASEPSKIWVLDSEPSGGLVDGLSASSPVPVEAAPTASFIDHGPAGQTCDACLASGASLGVLLSGGRHVSLVPPDVSARKRSSEKAQAVVTGVALAVVSVLLIWFALIAHAYRMQKFVAALDARADEIAPRARNVEAKRERLAAVKKQLEGQGRVLDVLVSLYRVTPPDIYLTSVEISPNGTLTLKGHAQQMFRAAEYEVLLEKEEVFGRSSGVLPSASQRTEGGKTFISFKIIRNLGEPREK